MNRNATNRARKIAIPMLCLAAVSITGCYSSSSNTLGFRTNPVVQDEYAVTDSVGAGLFGEQIRYQHAEANRRRLARQGQHEYATVPVDE